MAQPSRGMRGDERGGAANMQLDRTGDVQRESSDLAEPVPGEGRQLSGVRSRPACGSPRDDLELLPRAQTSGRGTRMETKKPQLN